MSTYNTEQKKQLIDFLMRHCERSYSADEAANELEKELGEAAPGKSTVYRLLSRLCDEGKIKRFDKNGERKAYYQIIAGHHCDRHLHMKCMGCGKLLHMSDSASQTVLNDVLAASEFCVDKENTVLFGVCADCRTEDKTK